MVRMAQDFNYRYMLVDGHGNFGSVDGDSAAAMRYTEARMSKISMEILRDITKDTIDYQDNYDGSEREPVVMPSRFPNLLVNGAAGIAVGMATNIPPHQLGKSLTVYLLSVRIRILQFQSLWKSFQVLISDCGSNLGAKRYTESIRIWPRLYYDSGKS